MYGVYIYLYKSSQNIGQDFIVLDFFHGRKILKVDGRDGRDPQNREKNAPAGRFTCMVYRQWFSPILWLPKLICRGKPFVGVSNLNINIWGMNLDASSHLRCQAYGQKSTNLKPPRLHLNYISTEIKMLYNN